MKLKNDLPGMTVHLLFGIVMGILAKYLDTLPVGGSRWNDILHYAGNVMTRPAIWVFFAVIIAVLSKTAFKAAIHTLMFFAGMLISYYLYSAELFGFFPMGYFLFWGAAALGMPLLAAIAWFGRHHSRLAGVLPALPLGLVLSLSIGVGYFYVDLLYIDEFIMYILLCAVFYRSPKQLALAAGLSVAAAVLLSFFMPIHF